MRRIRPAKHYQHPQAPVRALADKAIPSLSRALRTALKASRSLFDVSRAEWLLQQGRYREIADLIDWNHSDQAMRHPLAMLGDVWLAGGKVGARKINGAFTSRRRVVRYKKAAGVEERLHADGLTAPHRSAAAPILPEDWFEASIIEKDQSDLFNFDRFDPVTQAHIRSFQDALITQLGVDSRVTIEETILAALRAGKSPADIARQIKATIGLTDKQAAAVLRFRQQLEDMDPALLTRKLTGDTSAFIEARAAGKTIEASTIDQMAATYADNYLNYRALMIATTEATRASSLGLQDSYQQAIDRGAMPAEAVTQYWQISLDEKTCDHCLSVVDMNPDGVPFGEQFQSDDGMIDGPPYHPNCRCSLEFVTNLDLVPDDAGSDE